MLTHHVLFWLKASTSEEERASFRKGLESLGNIEAVKSIYIGKPAPIERQVVDNSYSYSLLTIFDNLEGHDSYQTDSLHLAFLDNFRQFFEKVVIYDSQ